MERWWFLELEVIQVAKQLEEPPGVRELQQFVSANREHKHVDDCAEAVVWRSGHEVRTSSPTSSWKSPAGPAVDSTSTQSFSVSQLALEESPNGQLAQVLEEARRNYVPPALGYPPPASRESFRHSTTMVEKAVPRLRNVAKKSAEMAAKVEQARNARATAEQNRDANEKALVEARSHFHKTQQEHFARFPSGCPPDNDVCAGQGAVLAVAASNKDASGVVEIGEVDGVVIELPEDADQETKDNGQQHRELEKRMPQLRGEMGAKKGQAQKGQLGKP